MYKKVDFSVKMYYIKYISNKEFSGSMFIVQGRGVT